MIPYENIAQASTSSGWLQSVIHEKYNTKQANGNFLSKKKKKRKRKHDNNKNIIKQDTKATVKVKIVKKLCA